MTGIYTESLLAYLEVVEVLGHVSTGDHTGKCLDQGSPIRTLSDFCGGILRTARVHPAALSLNVHRPVVSVSSVGSQVLLEIQLIP